MTDQSPASDGPRQRNRRKTEFTLELALNRLQRSGMKISIAAVANEAGVTPALLHNRYPDFAEAVRALIGKATRVQRDSKHALLVTEREKNRELRLQLSGLMEELKCLASINESLRVELTMQKAISSGKVAPIRP